MENGYEQFRILFEQATDGIFVADKDGNYTDVNPSGCKMLGYTEEEITKLSIADIITADEVARLGPDVELLLLDGTIKNHWKFRRKDQTVFVGEVTGFRLSDGHLLVIVQNITEQMLEKEVLSSHGDRFLLMLDHMLEGCQIIGFDWRYLYLNQAAEIHNRRPKEELLGNRFMDMWPGIEETELFKIIKTTLEQRVPLNLVTKFVFPDGVIGWYDLSIQPVPEGVFILSIDTTKRRKAEEALRESEEKYRLITDNSEDWLYWIAPDGSLKYLSPAVERVTGYSPQEFKTQPELNREIVFAEDREKLRQHNHIILQVSPADQMEFRIITKSGETRWIHHSCSPMVTSEGVYIGRRVSNQNITERKKVEEELIASKTTLETALASMTDAIVITDAEGNFIEFNEAFATFHRFKNKEECSKTFSEYPVFMEVFTANRQLIPEEQWTVPRALRGETDKNQEVFMHRKDTGETWIGSYSFAPIRDRNGVIVGTVVTGRDITESKQAEEALKLSEERYRNIFESAVIGLYRTTPEGEIILANSTLIKMLGFNSFEELAQRNLENEGFEDEVQRKVFRENIERDGRVTGLEAVWKTKEGKPVFVNENARAFYDQYGQVIYYEGTIEDITERKTMERTLEESDEKFRKAFLTNPDSIAINSLDNGRFISVNHGFTQIFEFTEREVIGKTSLELDIWHNPEDRLHYVRKLKEKGVVENFEAKLYTKSRKLKNSLISAAIIELEGVPHILSTIKDITERKLTEEAIRESEEKYRSVFENSSVAILLTSTDGYILSANKFACKLFDRSKEEMHNARRDSIIDITDPRMTVMLDERKRTGSVKGELRFIKKDGTTFPGELSSVIFKDMEGNERSSMVIRDLTAKKKIEEENQNLNLMLEQRILDRTAQLKDANQELEAFSYSVSHDLRAPLRHINGFVDLLTEKYQDLLPEKGRHYLNVIISSSRQMDTLIDDLLQFSRTGRQEMQQTDIDMNVVLQEVMILIAPELSDRKIEWTIAKLPLLTGDHALLRVAWYNLLSNAVKFTKAKDPAVIQIGFHQEENEYVFFVCDNGAGFDMKYAHKLFGVFQRLHSKEEFEGTGIGLANVHRIILKHGGRTWAESQPDHGATFYFTIPKNQEKEK